MKIGEFSKLVGLSISTLRYYEDQGFLHIERQNGIRNYHAEDVGFVQFIKRLKDMGMPIYMRTCGMPELIRPVKE